MVYRLIKVRRLEARVDELEERVRAVIPEADLLTHEPLMQKELDVAFEAAVSNVVASRCPGFTPQILATRPPWLLTKDAGEQLRAVVRGIHPHTREKSAVAAQRTIQADISAFARRCRI